MGSSSSSEGALSSGGTPMASARMTGKVSAKEAAVIQAALQDTLSPAKLHCSAPFLVSWYNETRVRTAGGGNQIDAPDDALGFALYTVPGYLDVVAEHYARNRPQDHFVDNCTDEILELLRKNLPEECDAMVVNTDQGPNYYHVQTVGTVCGNDEHIEVENLGDDLNEWLEDLSDQLEETRDKKFWGTDKATLRKIFGVNISPTYGGWFAYRALIILKNCNADLKRPVPRKFLDVEDQKRILWDYNLSHDECKWRDLTAEGHAPENRYTPEEYMFFLETKPAKRKRYLELRAATMSSPPPALRV